MDRQLEPRFRDDRVMEELRAMSPIMEMYDKWRAEDRQDRQDRWSGSTLPVGSTEAPENAERRLMVARFKRAQAALQARHDADDQTVIDHMGFNPFTD